MAKTADLSALGAVLGLVPARGGSKGIPRKNLRKLAGRPLLAYTVQAARQARHLATVVLSTDDAEIAELGERLGLEVPFLRPAALAADDSPTLDVVRHALEVLADRGRVYEAVCILQPTSPLRTAAQIDACIELLFERRADAVISVRRVPDEFHPSWVYFEREDGALLLSTGELLLSTGETAPPPRRQVLRPAYHRDGAIYVTRTRVLVEGSLYGNYLVGYRMPEGPIINLDTEEDWAAAEALLQPAG